MQPMQLAGYSVSMARSQQEIEQALKLRGDRFRQGTAMPDRDNFDQIAQHLLIRDGAGRLRATCRMTALAKARDFTASYTAQHYDLGLIAAKGTAVLEIGRLCLATHAQPDADTLRALWAGVSRQVFDTGATMLIGCSSFRGADPQRHGAALAHLHANHLGPDSLRPTTRAAEVVRLPSTPKDLRAALRGLPPLLRMYLGLGGWVSDHAVVDRDLDTLHVFTALELAAIPAARARTMRQLAAA